MSASPQIWLLRGCAPLALALLLGGCAGASGPGGYDYFARPDRYDPWSLQILRWQVRERDERVAAGPVASSLIGRVDAAPLGHADAALDLGERYRSFISERKLDLLRDVARWAQTQGASHYVSDDGREHWPTLNEVLARNGDDCDGLELLTYYLLRELGFRDVYRAVVVRPSDDQHHMVTLWFAEPGDPHVIDPTGAMARGAPRMSQVRGWRPLKVFDETREYSVRRRPGR